MARTRARTKQGVDAGAEPATELDGRKMGIRVHKLIGAMAEAGVREPDPATVIDWVSRQEYPAQASYLLSARQRLITAASIYFRLYEEPSWQLIGTEVSVRTCRFDLVWRTSDGAVICDEIKSGRVGVELSRRRIDEQAQRQVDNGRKEWGEDFGGVRVLFTYWPRQSFLALPTGEIELLFPEGDDE